MCMYHKKEKRKVDATPELRVNECRELYVEFCKDRRGSLDWERAR